MSDDTSKLPEVVDDKPITDMSEKELGRVTRYKNAGLPGIIDVNEDKLAKMMDLYLSGKTYSQISQITGIPKDIVLYLSQKMQWFEVKEEYLLELDERMKIRIIENKLMSQDHLLQLAQMYQKKIGHKITRYLSTGNEDIANGIDLKEVSAYLKILEALHKIGAAPVAPGPLIGITMPDGATMTRKSNNEIEITPKQKAIGDILKQHADMKRKEDKK
jgi:hypothetical protein